MAESVVCSLQQAVQRSLDLLLYDNAVFLAERLVAENTCLESVYTLANCHFQGGDVGSATRLLRHHYPFDAADEYWHSKCLYMLGVGYIRLQRHAEGERILSELAHCGSSSVQALLPAVHYWLALCSKSSGKKSATMDLLSSAVQKDYSLWVAAECGVQHFPNFDLSCYDDSSSKAKLPRSVASTTSNGGSTPPSQTLSMPADLKRPSAISPQPSTPKKLPVYQAQAQSSAARDIAAMRSAKKVASTPVAARTIDDNSLSMKQLLRNFAMAAKLLWTYKCTECVSLLTDSQYFSERQRGSGWVLSTLGRAHYENGQNSEAEQYWIQLRQREPWRMCSNLIYYSTALWHMKKEKELSCLAQQLIDADPLNYVSLCVTGNCYSLINEHPTALRFFKRSTQVCKHFAYAHTLMGHEHLAVDEVQEAEQCFRTALKLEPRHYAAIAGIGEVYHRQEQYTTARQHFEQSLEINPFPQLYIRLAMALLGLQDSSVEAKQHVVELFDAALARDQSNLLARHKRAELLISMGQCHKALQDLELLRSRCPKEAAIFITLGRCHRKLGNRQQAMFFFNHALDLDDRWNTYVKGVMDKLSNNSTNNANGRPNNTFPCDSD